MKRHQWKPFVTRRLRHRRCSACGLTINRNVLDYLPDYDFDDDTCPGGSSGFVNLASGICDCDVCRHENHPQSDPSDSDCIVPQLVEMGRTLVATWEPASTIGKDPNDGR